MLLIFGAGGQLGQELLQLACETGVPVKGLRRADADVADPARVAAALASFKPKIVVNAAAYAAVDRAEQEPDVAGRENSLAPEILARACNDAGVPMIHISTDYVFDGKKDGAYREADPVAPLGVYGRTKAEGETRVRNALSHHVILRTSWLYGIYGHNFLKTMLRQAAERDELRVVADQFGNPTGSADLAQAVLRLAELANADRDIWGTYHFAGTGSTNWHGFASEIVAQQAKFTGGKPAVRAVSTAEYPTASQRPQNSALDSSKFAEVFGMRALPWQERVADVVARLLA